MTGKNFLLLFIFTIVSLLLFSSAIVLAATNTPTIKRLSGLNRYETSTVVALSGWTHADYVILTSGEDFPDAISAAPLAKKYNAPILLTETNSIPADTLVAINQLKVKNVIIIGGIGVISSAVEQQLTSLGMTITRIFGQDRYETSIKIAEQLDNVTEAAIVTGEDFADALSIAPIAVIKNMPIILVPHTSIPYVVKKYISSHKFTTTYVIGYGPSLNTSVVTGLEELTEKPNIEIITGADKYKINQNIMSKFYWNLDERTIYLATGEDFADALSGSVLAGMNSNPLVLIKNDIDYDEYLFYNYNPIPNINILGGVNKVTDELAKRLVTLPTALIPSQPPISVKVVDGKIVMTNAEIVDGQIVISDPVSQPVDNSNTSSIVESAVPITKTAHGVDFGENANHGSYMLTRTGLTTATFKFKILDEHNIDITKYLSASDLDGYSCVGSWETVNSISINGFIPILANAKTSLDPTTGIGTITYAFSDTDKGAMVSIYPKNETQLFLSRANLCFGTSNEAADLVVRRIYIDPNLTKTEGNTTIFNYNLINNSDVSITKSIPVSQIAAKTSINSIITLDPLTETGTITYSSHEDIYKPITLSLSYIPTDIKESQEMNIESETPIHRTESPKVDKITITSAELSIGGGITSDVQRAFSGLPYTEICGYATYRVFDQYGEDITDSPYGASVKFQSDAGLIAASDGIITLAPYKDVNLYKLKSVIIAGGDSATKTSISVNLPVK